jgi:LacI family transcriptional regulator
VRHPTIDTRTTPPRPATLADVGALAGVSAATASRVLNGTGRRVADALRERVLAAAAELDYVPNAHAQALMRVDTKTVGVLAFDIGNPYLNQVLAGIFDVAGKAGRLVTIGHVGGDPATELAYIGLLRSQRVGSIVLTGSGRLDAEHNARMGAQLGGFRAMGGRVVSIGRHEVAGDAVMPDNVGGSAAAARALLGLGHTELGIVAGEEDLIVNADRVRGFREACAAAGHPVPDARVAHGTPDTEGGARGMCLLLDREPAVTGVFCANDAIAIGALRALRERGVDCPGRMSVVGFDDIPVARELTPALSTVHVPLRRLGEEAMQMLVAPTDEHQQLRLATEVRLRGTTARPA